MTITYPTWYLATTAVMFAVLIVVGAIATMRDRGRK